MPTILKPIVIRIRVRRLGLSIFMKIRIRMDFFAQALIRASFFNDKKSDHFVKHGGMSYQILVIGIANNNLSHCSCQKICANTNVLEVHGAAADVCHEEAALEDQEKGKRGDVPLVFRGVVYVEVRRSALALSSLMTLKGIFSCSIPTTFSLRSSEAMRSFLFSAFFHEAVFILTFFSYRPLFAIECCVFRSSTKEEEEK